MTAIKFCGITREKDAERAAGAGASAIGLVLWERSPRAVTVDRAAAIVRVLPPFVAPVAVFVSPTLDEVRAAVDTIGVRVVQLHGPLDLAPFLDGTWRVVRAVSVVDGVAPASIDARATVLVDAHDPVRHGGTGRTADWDTAAAWASARRVALAGGLTPENVGAAVRQVRPYAVDVASGIEVSPGVKDAARMRAFVARVREADQEMGA